MSEPTSSNPKPKRRRFQFSLRTLLAALLLSTFPMAWLGKQWREHRAEQRAVEEILKLGGRVSYEKDGQEFELIFIDEDKALPWWRHVEYVWFNDNQINDADLIHLQRLPQLQHLDLRCTPISDRGMIHLSKMIQIQRLFLNDTNISGAGLVHLKELTNLQLLNLNHTQISDVGIADLQKVLPNCEILIRQIDDKGSGEKE